MTYGHVMQEKTYPIEMFLAGKRGKKGLTKSAALSYAKRV
jgi:hypothetical protein